MIPIIIVISILPNKVSQIIIIVIVQIIVVTIMIITIVVITTIIILILILVYSIGYRHNYIVLYRNRLYYYIIYCCNRYPPSLVGALLGVPRMPRIGERGSAPKGGRYSTICLNAR